MHDVGIMSSSHAKHVLFGIMSQSGLCRIWCSVVREYVVWDYVVRVYVLWNYVVMQTDLVSNIVHIIIL